jgi:hypothetical protein
MDSQTPDFIIGGAMKAGTTSLHHILSRHPDVYIPDGEIRFFCVDDTIQHPDFWRVQDYDRDFERNLRWYTSFFESAGSDQLIGDDSTTYLPSRKAPERIRDLLPDVKLIFLLRDPVARTYSHYWHRVKTGRAVHRFEEELELGTSTLYLRSYYKSQLERYFEIFPENQIKVVVSERFFERPQEVMNNVWEFLDLDAVELENTRTNKSPAPRSLHFQLLLNYVASGTRQRHSDALPGDGDRQKISFSKRFGRSLWFRLTDRNLDTRSYPPMNSELRRRLSRIFARENEGLSDLIGTDVTQYWPSMKEEKR